MNFNFIIQIAQTYNYYIYYSIVKMRNTLSLLLLLSVAVFASREPLVTCPTGLAPIDLFSDSFSISSSHESAVQLANGEDTSCYNYSLPTTWLVAPSVAVAINQLEASDSNDLYFSIKPLWTWTYNQIPFLVRTQWKYTKWVKLTVNFLVESRKDIEVGYVQRDTPFLRGCNATRRQALYIPFQSQGWDADDNGLTVRLFLNGFEIQTVNSSPFQIELLNPTYNQTGINLLAVSNVSTINTVFVSYVVFRTKGFGIRQINGFLEFQSIQSFSQPILQNGFQNFKYFLYGVSGFSLNALNNQVKFNVGVDTSFLANFNFYGNTLGYVGFQFLIFAYAPCTNCVGYQLAYNTQCVKTCPQGALLVDQACFVCPINSYGSGLNCICKQGYYNISGQCSTCPMGQIFQGGQCIGCAKNAIWVGTLCTCASGYFNISGQCQQCKNGTYWNGYTCIGCGANSYWFAGVCTCNPGYSKISDVCQKCPVGTVFNGKECSQPCQVGMIWTGLRCENLCEKVRNSFWNGIQCLCNSGYYNNSRECIRCDAPNQWNGVQCIPTTDQIQVRHDQDWSSDNNAPTRTDPDDPNFTPNKVSCAGGSYFDQQALKCLPCPTGCTQCANCTVCQKCGSGFIQSASSLCSEICGDGLRFILPCDDGNTVSGDGCSSTCAIESGWICTGGSPTSKDTCTQNKPTAVSLVQTGQSMSDSSVTVNVRVNYLPSSLTSGSSDCQDCNNILTVSIVSGSQASSISAFYIPGSSFSFAITFNFMGSTPGPFKANVQINPALQSYFQGIDISKTIQVKVTPVTLSKASGAKAAN